MRKMPRKMYGICRAALLAGDYVETRPTHALHYGSPIGGGIRAQKPSPEAGLGGPFQPPAHGGRTGCHGIGRSTVACRTVSHSWMIRTVDLHVLRFISR
jgi:hypothetical protein